MSKSRRFLQFDSDFELSDVTTYHVGSLESASHRAMRSFKDACLKKYGITGMQWYIIGTIRDSGNEGMRITDLSKQLGTTLGFMTNSVNLLVTKGILHRLNSTTDSRSKIVVLTDSYKRITTEIEEDLRVKLRQTIYKELSPSELKAYIKTLQILANIDHSLDK